MTQHAPVDAQQPFATQLTDFATTDRSCPQAVLDGLDTVSRQRVARAWAMMQALTPTHGATGEPLAEHGAGTAALVAELGLDADSRIAAMLFGFYPAEIPTEVGTQLGDGVVRLIKDMQQLLRLGQLFARQEAQAADVTAKDAAQQTETLRRMLLAMADDLRVVLLRLASRLQTLRWFAASKVQGAEPWGRETLRVFAPLANRLGVWQLKWELEDLGFRFTQPDVYKRIARLLDEKRVERERFVNQAIANLEQLMSEQGIVAQVSGRPKHIYSIWNKMRHKGLEFDELYDIRAFRVIVDDIRSCYAVLGIVHQIWQPVPREFDDYISRPKGNGYQSLHTVVIAEDDRPIEIQIRTAEMHRFAEYGVAAHWRYKEGGGKASAYDARVAWLRQLLAWRSELSGQLLTGDGERLASTDPAAALSSSAPMPASLAAEPMAPDADDRVYALTPAGRIIELPIGSTAIDFAYHVHTDLGHRCRGAKVDGQMVPLDRPLITGQTVEIIAAKEGGPSRDWLKPEAGYLQSHRGRQKARQWFHAQELEQQQASGRSLVERAMQREGKTALGFDTVAQRLGFGRPEDLFVACARDEVGPRELEAALRQEQEPPKPEHVEPDDYVLPVRAPVASTLRAKAQPGDVLVVGIDKLLTQLAKCCKPAPPDPIAGFVTRGRGVSIHREDCPTLASLRERAPERLIQTAWGDVAGMAYPVDLEVRADDRHALLRDVSEVFARQKINVTSVSTQSLHGTATMRFTVELPGHVQLQRVVKALCDVPGVVYAGRRQSAPQAVWSKP